jgi:hypothetical protein
MIGAEVTYQKSGSGIMVTLNIPGDQERQVQKRLAISVGNMKRKEVQDMKDFELRAVPITSIIMPAKQIRKQLNMDQVEIFANLLREDRDVEPIIVLRYRETQNGESNPQQFFPIDGFHRIAAHQTEGRKEIRVKIDTSKTVDREFLATNVGKNFIELSMARHNCGQSLPLTRQEMKELVRGIIARSDNLHIVGEVMEATKLPKSTLYELAGDLLKRRKYVTNKRILELHEKGNTISDIAKEVCRHENTVSRHIQQARNSQNRYQSVPEIEESRQSGGECDPSAETLEDRRARKNDMASMEKGDFYSLQKKRDGSRVLTVHLPKQVGMLNMAEAQRIGQIIGEVLNDETQNKRIHEETTKYPAPVAGRTTDVWCDVSNEKPTGNKLRLNDAIDAFFAIGEGGTIAEIAGRFVYVGIKKSHNFLRTYMDRKVAKGEWSKRRATFYIKKKDKAQEKTEGKIRGTQKGRDVNKK